MGFRVEIAPRAFADVDAISEHIRNRGSFESAQKWFNSIIGAIATLAEMPQRCPVAAESRDLDQEVRVMLHGRRGRAYKVYYAIDYSAESVHVFHVRHWARGGLAVGEIKDLL